MGELRTKRIYEPASKDDGLRVFVERLWPRGVAKEKAQIDLWLKEIAPSTELRKWFNHDPAKWQEFKRRYRSEIKSCSDRFHQILDSLKRENVTLLYSSREERFNAATALKSFLEETSKKQAD